jgi:hypothetical protein
MMPAQATAEPGADPNNITNQLATILRESFGIEPKAEDTSTKSHTLITMMNSLTLEAIEPQSFLGVVGIMVKPH